MTTTRTYTSFQTLTMGSPGLVRKLEFLEKSSKNQTWEKRALSRALICSCGGRQAPAAALTQPTAPQDAQHPWPSLVQLRQGCCTTPGSLCADRAESPAWKGSLCHPEHARTDLTTQNTGLPSYEKLFTSFLFAQLNSQE